MTSKVSIDKAGRIVLPKPVRDRLRLDAGDSLTLDLTEDSITLSPVRSEAVLKKEMGVWVFQGGMQNDSIVDLIDRIREERIADLLK